MLQPLAPSIHHRLLEPRRFLSDLARGSIKRWQPFIPQRICAFRAPRELLCLKHETQGKMVMEQVGRSVSCAGPNLMYILNLDIFRIG